jgi:transcriptional regulator with XRE-family HTH domain
MGTLGSYVRSAREARGLDLRDVAQQTRISVGFLKAIEEEDFSKLPGEVFVKGFLKSYAKFLRLPEDEIMKRYAEIGAPRPAAPASADAPAAPAAQKAPKTAKVEPPKAAPAEAPPAAPDTEKPGRIGLEPFLWAGAVIVGIAAFIITALPEKQKSGSHAPATTSRGTATDGIVAAPTATVKPEKLYLDIVALEDVWVLVRTDASPQKKAALKKGETVTWSANERFLLSYSSVGAAKLVLNGKDLEVRGSKNAVVRDLIITSAGVAFQKVEPEKPKPRTPKPVTQTTLTAQPQPQQTQPQPAPPAPSAPPAAVEPTPPSAPKQIAPIFPPPRE